MRKSSDRKARKRHIVEGCPELQKIQILENDDESVKMYDDDKTVLENKPTDKSSSEKVQSETSLSTSILQAKMCNVKIPLVPLEYTNLMDSRILNELRNIRTSLTVSEETKSVNTQALNKQQNNKTLLIQKKHVTVRSQNEKQNNAFALSEERKLSNACKLKEKQSCKDMKESVISAGHSNVDILHGKENHKSETYKKETEIINQDRHEKQKKCLPTSFKQTKLTKFYALKESLKTKALNAPLNSINSTSNDNILNKKQDTKDSKQGNISVQAVNEHKDTNIKITHVHTLNEDENTKSSFSLLKQIKIENVHTLNEEETINSPAVPLEQIKITDVHSLNEQKNINPPVMPIEAIKITNIQTVNEDNVKSSTTPLEQMKITNVHTLSDEQMIKPSVVPLEFIKILNVQTVNERQNTKSLMVSSDPTKISNIHTTNEQQNLKLSVLPYETIKISNVHTVNEQLSMKPPVVPFEPINITNIHTINEQISMKPSTVSFEPLKISNVHTLNEQQNVKFSTAPLDQIKILNVHSLSEESNIKIPAVPLENVKFTNNQTVSDQNLKPPIISLDQIRFINTHSLNEAQDIKLPVIPLDQLKVMGVHTIQEKQNTNFPVIPVNSTNLSNIQRFNELHHLKVPESVEQNKLVNFHPLSKSNVPIISTLPPQNNNTNVINAVPKVLTVNPNVNFTVLGTNESHPNFGFVTDQIPAVNNSVVTSIPLTTIKQDFSNVVTSAKSNLSTVSNNSHMPLQPQIFKIKCPRTHFPIISVSNASSVPNISNVIYVPISEAPLMNTSNVSPTPVINLPTSNQSAFNRNFTRGILNTNMSNTSGFIKVTPNSALQEVSQIVTPKIPLDPLPLKSTATAKTKSILMNMLKSDGSNLSRIETDASSRRMTKLSTVSDTKTVCGIPAARKVTIPLFQANGLTNSELTPNTNTLNKNTLQSVVMEHNYALSSGTVKEKFGKMPRKECKCNETESSTSDSDSSTDSDILNYDDNLLRLMEPEVVLLEGAGSFILTKGGDLKYLKPFQPMYSRHKPLKDIKNEPARKKPAEFNCNNTITGIILDKKSRPKKFVPVQQKFVFRNGEVASSLLQSCFVWLDRMNKDLLKDGVVNLAEVPLEELFLLDDYKPVVQSSSKCKYVRNENTKRIEETRKRKSRATVGGPRKDINEVSKMAEVLKLLQDRRKALEALRYKRKLFQKRYLPKPDNTNSDNIRQIPTL
ncbi:uncharacterized protein LOC111617233 [Centruroides sculpturatus]|uniref:uncharacterized protein LOC111617233 n=1 Tax=Centruroides sculpturatus TaxID=218467 RepID=UPI000C6D550C|nr:uncharacterized protein LOC111617233 [Centruroides sculpturatus]